jgi:two-component system phosphate regulon sensor histidine kinase PhoR
MPRNAFRTVIVLASLLVVGILLSQYLFLRKAYDFQEKSLDQNIRVALLRVRRQLLTGSSSYQDSSGITQLSTKCFVGNLEGQVEQEKLKGLLKKELAKVNIPYDFQFSIFDPRLNQLVSGLYVSPGKPDTRARKIPDLPVYRYSGPYFCVYFPYKATLLEGEVGGWTLLSGLLLLALAFFVYTTYVLLHQKRLSEVQRDFIHTLSHEFQTPIATIGIASEALKTPGMVEGERIFQYASMIQEEAVRLKEQVETVLQVARIDQQKMKMDKQPVHLHDCIEKVVEKMGMALQARGTLLVKELNATTAVVYADPLHLFHILYNLLDNALKYSEGSPQVTICTENKGRDLLLSIADKGVGIPKKEAKRIFQKFYRVPSLSMESKGFGIGLYYVLTMTKALQGKVFVESEPGKGSTFYVLLPQHPPL